MDDMNEELSKIAYAAFLDELQEIEKAAGFGTVGTAARRFMRPKSQVGKVHGSVPKAKAAPKAPSMRERLGQSPVPPPMFAKQAFMGTTMSAARRFMRPKSVAGRAAKTDPVKLRRMAAQKPPAQGARVRQAMGQAPITPGAFGTA